MTSPTKDVQSFYELYRPDVPSFRLKHIKTLGDSPYRTDWDDGKLHAGEIITKECLCYYLFNVYIIDIASRYVVLCIKVAVFMLETKLVIYSSVTCCNVGNCEGALSLIQH